ncbi:MAG: hypothetical protein JO214_16765 [Frankiaceae bacterium]|nr:hypothetical protein [Frankiaceae bacterium]
MDAIAWWGTRLGGAAMLGATAGIHADLYQSGYKHLDRIGPMFLLLVIGASVLCIAVVVSPQRALPLAATAGALTELATAAGLLILTHHTIPGLKGFRESSAAPHYWSSITVEAIGFVLLTALAVWSTRRNRVRS